MIIIKLTEHQAEIMNKCMKNYFEYLDKQIVSIEDESVKDYAINRKADTGIVVKVTTKAILDWEQSPDSL